MNNDRLHKWTAIRELTDAMTCSADEGEWERVTELECRRKERLEAFFTHPVSPSDAPAVAEAIRELMALDKAIASRGASARDEITRELNMITQGRKASAAYSRNR